jgi:hypothetical protein
MEILSAQIETVLSVHIRFRPLGGWATFYVDDEHGTFGHSGLPIQ